MQIANYGADFHYRRNRHWPPVFVSLEFWAN